MVTMWVKMLVECYSKECNMLQCTTVEIRVRAVGNYRSRGSRTVFPFEEAI